MSLSSMASDTYSSQATPFRLMPGFAYSGNLALRDQFAPGTARELFRVYVSTDVDCVNIVYRGSIVGSPAWAPRTTGGLVLPSNSAELSLARSAWIIGDGKNGKTFAVDEAPLVENESLTEQTTGQEASLQPPLVDLWDNGWPEHRYFYTAVPVRIRSSAKDPNVLEYQETELPQDVCASGRVFTFDKLSEAVVAAAGAAPYVSGLSTSGRLFTANRSKPSIYGSPLVAWKPALGADRYEVQWSKKAYPWAKAGSLETRRRRPPSP